ncbi:cofactor assembly of complex C subunit B [Phormidesmis priestleyi ULC007]|uniref:Cofactor assembly of complex C subunit B n=1 Tax=Phormidesmis priestleyi ULC007 TaxID=1920490 RepID=A0A2T1DFR0_9CYAN|nr:cofactor assembly of complex C subunit B [Phormidesmis priestleyi]PSB19305.1 cofactor assembly of complex C subunit B [Phormidesmis priestleyi ULC007]PZO52190.1 MAG: cofactor assembly of complex C subunit B [Phormidesmis priestleyi]
MSTSVIPSTFFLTILMTIGLVFFIRASVKDRTQVIRLASDQSETSLLTQLQQYFDQRAYRVVSLDAAKNEVIFEGTVRPSLFLAGFLILLAATGALCLVLMLSYLFPDQSKLWLSLLLLSPLAGVFYWRGAGRSEQVSLKIESVPDAATKSLITVKAHRDELAELQRLLGLKTAT